MKVYGIIPARFQSSRFPGKMMAQIYGKTVIQRTYESASTATRMDKLTIATDDERIFLHAKSFGADVVMTAKECLNGTERLVDAIKKYKNLADADIYVNIQGDRPCVQGQHIDALVEELIAHPEDGMTTTIVKIDDPEEVLQTSTVKCVVDSRGYALYFSRSPIPFYKKKGSYFKHVGIYAFRKEFLLQFATMENTPLQLAEDLEQMKILEHGQKIRTVVVDGEIDLSVDYPTDIEKVEKWLCQNTSSLQEAFFPH